MSMNTSSGMERNLFTEVLICIVVWLEIKYGGNAINNAFRPVSPEAPNDGGDVVNALMQKEMEKIVH